MSTPPLVQKDAVLWRLFIGLFLILAKLPHQRRQPLCDFCTGVYSSTQRDPLLDDLIQALLLLAEAEKDLFEIWRYVEENGIALVVPSLATGFGLEPVRIQS